MDLHGRGIVLECATIIEREMGSKKEKKKKEEMTNGSQDVVIDSGHSIRALERNSTGCEEEILIFGGMTLEFYKERSMKDKKG